MLEISFRSVVGRDDQWRVLQRSRQWRGHRGARSIRRKQRDSGQLIVGEVLDTTRIPGDAHQIGIMHHHDLAVGGKLQIQFDAITGLASGGESGQRILRSDRTGRIGVCIAGLQSHASRQCHVFAAFGSVLRGETGTGVVQSSMGVPCVGNHGHVVAPLIGEGARGDRPSCGSGSHGTANQRFFDERT